MKVRNCGFIKLLLLTCSFAAVSFYDVSGGVLNMFDLNYWRCVLKKNYQCPDNNIRFYLYNHDTGIKRKRIDIRNRHALYYSGWDSDKKNVILVHGFNGSESKSPMTILRDAYLSREDYNIFTVDWKPLTQFPCYLSSLSNTRLVAQCTAQLYAYIMDLGGFARKTKCIGHSLGAHICGMMSNHLDVKQHEIVGLDPARPLIDRFGSQRFRLTKNDAEIVQVIHTNAGFLGEVNQVGTVDFCVNGGRMQPGCKGHLVRKARCSHFKSVCYFAASVRNGDTLRAQRCDSTCPQRSSVVGGGAMSVPMGENTPKTAQGMYCLEVFHEKACPFD